MMSPFTASRTTLNRARIVLTFTGFVAVVLVLLHTPTETPEPLTLPLLGTSLPADPEPVASTNVILEDLVRNKVVPVLDWRMEHLLHLGVAPWHSAGYRGRGVKIAVLDSGFRGYRDHLGKALPSMITARSFRFDNNLEGRDSQHGILCAEVIHALAPEAEILLANWEPDDAEQFLKAVRWARQQGARVISCSMIMPGWSDGEGGGSLHWSLAQILGKGNRTKDVLFVASAGNTAQRHWCGAFRDNGDGFHLWKPGRKDNKVLPYGDDPVSVELYERPGDKKDYELRVYDRTAKTEVGRCTTSDLGKRCCATVKFLPKKKHVYTIDVKRLHGKTQPFHLMVLAGGLTYSTARGSIPFPADGAAVIAVGAVGTDGHREIYSSCGLGTRRTKPDLVAPVPFVSSWRIQPFGGTSAAAPQAAALAALCCSRYPQWTANQVRVALHSSACNLGPHRPDRQTGYGLVRLPQELNLASGR